jgi:hypothetical protein
VATAASSAMVSTAAAVPRPTTPPVAHSMRCPGLPVASAGPMSGRVPSVNHRARPRWRSLADVAGTQMRAAPAASDARPTAAHRPRCSRRVTSRSSHHHERRSRMGARGGAQRAQTTGVQRSTVLGSSPTIVAVVSRRSRRPDPAAQVSTSRCSNSRRSPSNVGAR